LPLASFRLSLAADALAFRLALPLAGCAADLNRQVSAPCRAHYIKSSTVEGLLFMFKDPL
jgi:hypothetical protein